MVGGLTALVAEQLHPDHLALLPEGRGACSVADGAGLFVNTAEMHRYSELFAPLVP